MWAERSELREHDDTTLFVDVTGPPPRLGGLRGGGLCRGACAASARARRLAPVSVVDPRSALRHPRALSPEAEEVIRGLAGRSACTASAASDRADLPRSADARPEASTTPRLIAAIESDGALHRRHGAAGGRRPQRRERLLAAGIADRAARADFRADRGSTWAARRRRRRPSRSWARSSPCGNGREEPPAVALRAGGSTKSAPDRPAPRRPIQPRTRSAAANRATATDPRRARDQPPLQKRDCRRECGSARRARRPRRETIACIASVGRERTRAKRRRRRAFRRSRGSVPHVPKPVDRRASDVEPCECAAAQLGQHRVGDRGA